MTMDHYPPKVKRNGSTRAWRNLRAQILFRDRYVCQSPGCDKLASEVDHIQPVAMGGSDHPSNLRSVCPTHQPTY